LCTENHSDSFADGTFFGGRAPRADKTRRLSKRIFFIQPSAAPPLRLSPFFCPRVSRKQ